MDVVLYALQHVHVGPDRGEELRGLGDLARLRGEHDHAGQGAREAGLQMLVKVLPKDEDKIGVRAGADRARMSRNTNFQTV